MHKVSRIAVLAAITVAAGVHAQSSCSSDGVPPPTALLERFISADCATCWADKYMPKGSGGAAVIDWIVPTSRGEGAPLSAGATRDALERLKAQRAAVPAGYELRMSPSRPLGTLRVARGLPFNDYIGTSIEWRGATGDGPWTAWLVLVESVPAGTEGSPVARNLVRNALQLDWQRTSGGSTLADSRSMHIPEGARPERLAVIGWVQDTHGAVKGIARSHCAR